MLESLLHQPSNRSIVRDLMAAARCSESDLREGLERGDLTLRRSVSRAVVSSVPKKERALPPALGPVPAWLELELVDDSGAPVAGARYRVVTETGAIYEGQLDDAGQVRIEDLPSHAPAKVSFPDFDGRAWRAA
jgi:hypothetical protein